MSPIGKIFVVLNLIFSLVILGVLGGILSKSEEYKTKYDSKSAELDTEMENWNQERSDLVVQIEGHKNDKAAMQQRLDDLDVINKNLTNDNDSLKVDNQQLRDDISKLQGDYQKFTASLNELHSHNQQLIAKNEELTAARTAAVDAQRAAQEDSARFEAQVRSLTSTVDQLKTQIADLEGISNELSAQIEAAVQSGFDIASVRAAPQIDAVIQNVNHGLDLVVLSVGADDGVERGTTFIVHADGSYKGKVVVEDVYPDNCSARILRPEGLSMPGDISVMDKATTRL